ncbi:MAG TPA: SDR family oxidoreductase [Mycobacteriales bacterium]
MTGPTPGNGPGWRLDGLVALVTGAARGIGLAISHTLAELGAEVAMADLRPSEEWRDARATVPASDGPVSAHQVDVRDAQSCRRVVAEVLDRHGRCDLLVNNAGVLAWSAAEHTTEDEWRQVLDVNAGGTFWMSQAALPALRRSPHAAVVNLSSTAGLVAVSGSAAYGISKAAVAHLTRVLALEWAGYGIRVNAVAPTIVPTDMNTAARADPAYLDAKLATIPLGRMVGADEVAGAVAYLCSPAAASITGHILTIDGGATIH